MSTSSRLVSLLLVTTALGAPGIAFAQSTPAAPATPPATEDQVRKDDAQATPQPGEPAPQDQAAPEVSVPGGAGDIVITGRTARNSVRASTEVTNLLSSADIARTGEGDIAGALGRVTGTKAA